MNPQSERWRDRRGDGQDRRRGLWERLEARNPWLNPWWILALAAGAFTVLVAVLETLGVFDDIGLILGSLGATVTILAAVSGASRAGLRALHEDVVAGVAGVGFELRDGFARLQAESVATRDTFTAESRATREAITAESQATREAITAESRATREAITTESRATREAITTESRATREAMVAVLVRLGAPPAPEPPG